MSIWFESVFMEKKRKKHTHAMKKERLKKERKRDRLTKRERERT